MPSTCNWPNRFPCRLAIGVALVLLAAAPARATPDSLDPAFGSGGIASTGFGSPGDIDVSVAIARQSDGKLVLAGSADGAFSFSTAGDFGVARFNENGTIDTTFDGDGRVVTSFVADPNKADEAWAVAIQPDGKIVVAGMADTPSADVGDFAIARYNANGTPDTSFDTDGMVTADAASSGFSHDRPRAVALQSDGKIVVAGGSDSDEFAVLRFNANGSPDTSFDGDGKVTTDVRSEWDEAHAVGVQADGKIVVAGFSEEPGSIFLGDYAVVRYNANGSLDMDFDGDGIATTEVAGGDDRANAMLIQADGKIVLAGEASPETPVNYDFGLARFNANGSPDTSFGGDGTVTAPPATPGANGIAATATGKLVVAGGIGDFRLGRFNADGTLDTGFDGDGIDSTPISPNGDIASARGVVVQPDGKPVVGGYADMGPAEFADLDFVLARYRPDGDSTPPPAPSLDATDPPSPANQNQPKIIGSAEGGSTVSLYDDAACSGGAMATGSAASFASPGLQVTVGNDSTTTFHATARDAAGNVSDCSSDSIEYVEDSTPPSAPSITDTDPNSPANENSPEVKGSAAAGSTVRLYASVCGGTALATGGATEFASPGLTVSVGNNTSTNLRARATDEAGNASPCSTGFTYVEDSNPPSAPTLTDTDPNSPANANMPHVKGVAEAGSTVNVYATAGCTGSPAAAGGASAFGSPGLVATVLDNSSTTFRARATDASGNTSACSSSSIVYVEDSAAPAPPELTGTDPESPSNDDTPRVQGSAEVGSTVKLYTSVDCTGPANVQGSAATFASPGLEAAVANDASTTLRGTATDLAGNVSDCSGSSLTYVEDSTAAAPALTDTDPDSPANDNAPRIKGAAETGSTVSLYDNALCVGPPVVTGSAVEFASPGLPVFVPDNSSTTFSGTVTDALGNVSPCSTLTVSYVEDSSQPPPPQAPGGTPFPPFAPPSSPTLPLDESLATAVIDAPDGMAGRARANSRRRFRVPRTSVACPAGGVECDVTVKVSTAKRVRVKPTAARRRKVRLATKTLFVDPGDASSLRMRLTRRGLAVLRRLRRVRAVAKVVAYAEAPEPARRSVTFVLLRPRR